MPLNTLDPTGPLNMKHMTVEPPAPNRTFNPQCDIPENFWRQVDEKIDALRKNKEYVELFCAAMHCRMAGKPVEISDDEIHECLQLMAQKQDGNQVLTVFASLTALGRKPAINAKVKELLLQGVHGYAGRSASVIFLEASLLGDPELLEGDCSHEVRSNVDFFRLDAGCWNPQQFAAAAAAMRMSGELVEISEREWKHLRAPGHLWSDVDSGYTVAKMPANLAILAAEDIQMTPSGLVLTHKERPSTRLSFPEIPHFVQSLHI